MFFKNTILLLVKRFIAAALEGHPLVCYVARDNAVLVTDMLSP